MVFVCHMIWKDHRIKGLCDFMVGRQSCLVTTLPNLVTLGIVVVEI